MANMPCGFPLRPIYAPASPCQYTPTVRDLVGSWIPCEVGAHWKLILSPLNSSGVSRWAIWLHCLLVALFYLIGLLLFDVVCDLCLPVSPGGSGGWQRYLFPTCPSPAQPGTEQVLQTALSIQVSFQLYSSRPSLYISFHNAEFFLKIWIHSASLESPLHLDLVSDVT